MNTSLTYDVVIVGAGASGLMCALQCARRGQKTLLLEKALQPGRKILVSGNGRCNLTNATVSASDYRGTPELAAAVLKDFSFQDCLSFFHSLGVLAIQEGQGRVFPLSGKATAVCEALCLACREAGVELIAQKEVKKINHKKSYFELVCADGTHYQANRCVLACGSCAYPQAGGTNAGYELARSLGHHLTDISPALCALNIKEKALARLQGIRLQGVIRVPDLPTLQTNINEILFTAYGVSGPAALNVSGPIGRLLAKGPVRIEVDMLPQITDKYDFLKQRAAQFPSRHAKAFFAGMLHENIANLLIDFAGIRKQIAVETWTENTWKSLASTLHAWPLTVTSLRPWTEAMVAAGGVKCGEINYNTMESLCCPGLYLVGEMLDVDGRSGGFNLHFAWGSAYKAAKAIAEGKL